MRNLPLVTLLVAAILFSATRAPAATAVATYEFNNVFTADESGAPGLLAVDPLGVSKFTTDTVLGQSRTVWAFNGDSAPADQSGLIVNTTGLVEPRSYSVDMVMEFTQRDGAWRRLIDVQNRQSDDGFYVNPSNNLEVYPTGGSTAAWTNNVYHHVVLTNDGMNVEYYLDGVAQAVTTTTLLNLDGDPTDNPGQLMAFFLDNVAGGGQGEWSAGYVSLIRLWDGVLTSEEAQALAKNPFAAQPPSVTITSPPAGVTLVGGQTAYASATVSSSSATISSVGFSIDGAAPQYAPAGGPYAVSFTVPSAGSHMLTVVATDSGGLVTTQQSGFVSLDPDPANPAPTVAILTDFGGRNLASGSTLDFTAGAFANTAGEPLQEVDFYADGVLFERLDGSGMPITNSAERPVRLDATAAGTVFTAQYQVPGVTKLTTLLAVALSQVGRAQTSQPVTAQAVANAPDHPPVVSIGGPANGATIKAGVAVNIPVAVADPDGPTPAALNRPTRHAFDVSPVIARVEYYLNSVKVKDSAATPYGYSVTAPTSGSYALSVVATDGAGLATVSAPVVLEAVEPPNVTLSVKGEASLSEGGGSGKALFHRDGDLSAALTVYFKAKGSAKNGVDYQTLPASVTIQAGVASAKLKLKPIGSVTGAGERSIKIQLKPSPTGDYNIGASSKAVFTLSP